MKLGAKDWLLIAIAIVVAGICARLGIWQLDRLGQRKARNAVITAGRAQPAVALSPRIAAPESLAERPVRADGVYDYDRERIWPARGFDGVPGVAVLTPLRLADGGYVFVDRGWVSSPDGRTIDLRAFRESDSVSVTGIAAVAPRGRGDVEPSRLRDSFPGPLLPIVVRQLPIGALSYVRRWREPELNNGPHLMYAVQWFSFATIALVGTALLLRKR
jgi:surfeit locus 1 family protein